MRPDIHVQNSLIEYTMEDNCNLLRNLKDLKTDENCAINENILLKGTWKTDVTFSSSPERPLPTSDFRCKFGHNTHVMGKRGS